MPQLFLQQDMEGVESFDVAGGSAAIVSCKCPGKETPNEDAAAIVDYSDRRAVLVVADGVGGLRRGDEASRLAIEAICDSLTNAEAESSLRTAILNGIELANREILELGIGAATTLAVVEIEDHQIRPYHVGDSSVLIFGQRGKVKWQTVAHSPVGFAVESGMLDTDDALHHEDRHIVSNVVGSPEMRIEIGPVLRLSARDTVLLGSDGLFDNLHANEIVNLSRTGPLRRAVGRLVELARERMLGQQDDVPGKPDDATIIAYRRRSPSSRN